MPVTDDEIREKYLERAIRELNTLTRELQACPHCPRGNLMPVLGSGHPQADVMLLKYAPRALGDRGGRRLLRPRRQRADEVAEAPVDRSAGGLRDAVREVPAQRRLARRPACVARVVEEIAIVQPKIVVVMGADALAALNELDIPLARPLQRAPRRDPAADADDRRAVRAQHRRLARRAGRQARVLGGVPHARRLVRRAAALLSRAEPL